MLGKLTRELPRNGYLYEPKWDGFRCLAFRGGERVDLRSRHGRPLARYFPELVEALRALPAERLAMDGEIVLAGKGGFDFGALMARLHPATSRVEQLSRETPAALIVFDLLELDGRELADRPFAERRRLLTERLGEAAGRLRVSPITDDPERAERWLRCPPSSGIDGVMAKRPDDPYRAGSRAMLKVKLERTADCVVAGFRPHFDRPQVASLLLGLYDEAGQLQHIGVASSFSRWRGEQLLHELEPLSVEIEGHPWERGFLTGGGPLGRLPGAAGRWDPAEMALDWVPVEPRRVCEVAYDHAEGGRFRHAARWRRWRPDREPRSCGFDQLEEPRAASSAG